MSPEPQLVYFLQQADGIYVGGPWPELVLIADGLLVGQALKVEGDALRFEVRNGSAIYHRAGESVNGATPFKRGGHIYSVGAINA